MKKLMLVCTLFVMSTFVGQANEIQISNTNDYTSTVSNEDIEQIYAYVVVIYSWGNKFSPQITKARVYFATMASARRFINRNPFTASYVGRQWVDASFVFTESSGF